MNSGQRVAVVISSRLPLPMGRHISEVHPQRIKLKQRKEISCADLEKMVQSGTATDARPHLGLAGPRFHTQDSVSPLHGLKTIRATEICDSPLGIGRINEHSEARSR